MFNHPGNNGSEDVPSACMQREVVMDMERLTKKSCAAVKAAVLIVTFLFAATAPDKPVPAQDENITVSCYKGNAEEGNYIGDLTETTPENAGQDCNSLYYDCQGECLGCFPDSDFTEDVCYDNTGRKFLK
jgi:hypothetical protein